MATNDAEYYQHHKDDDDEWGEAQEPSVRTRRRNPLTAMVSVRLDEGELERIRSSAEGRGESVSQFIRQAALERAGAAPAQLVSMTRTEWTAAGLGTAAISVPGMANAAVTVTGGTRPSLAGAQDDPHHKNEVTLR